MDPNKPICQVCGEGNITDEVSDVALEWLGRKGTRVFRHQECDHCKGHFTNYPDSVHNQKAVIDFRAQIESEEPRGQTQEAQTECGAARADGELGEVEERPLEAAREGGDDEGRGDRPSRQVPQTKGGPTS